METYHLELFEPPKPSATPDKRKRNTLLADENTPSAGSRPPTDSAPPKKKAKMSSAKFTCDCIDAILDVIKAQNWPFACFLYNVFRTKDINGKLVNRSQTHGQMVSAFLAGRGKRTVANIVNEWMKDPLGRIPRYSSAESLMFSTTILFTEIGPVRAALTTFSTQTIGKKVGEEAENAVKLTSGLHVSVGVRGPETKLHWSDVGANTIPQVESVIEREQPVTVYMFDKIGMRKPRKRNGVVLERKIRPPKGVITHTISALNFCRTDQANLLPLARGILYFGSSAPIELMNYDSRIGNMPSYSTVRHALLGLSAQEALDTAAHGKDPMKAGSLLIDNCQNQDKQRDLRIGRESVMNVGMSGLYMEAPDIDVDLFDLGDKRKHVEQNLGKHLTVDQLLGFIDQEGADLTGTLLVLEALTRGVAELKPRHAEVLERLRATATLLAPPGQNVVHPLASSGRQQTIPTELMDAMLDSSSKLAKLQMII
ncbi:hypothetical protein B0H13DRAFT_2364986 [Mycena leptocephala]|nr:hypothetical protein B0H13DRAFT_2364986 [Mycena leptocephala]